MYYELMRHGSSAKKRSCCRCGTSLDWCMIQPLAQLVIAVASDRHQSSAVRIQSSGHLMYSVSCIDKTKNKIKIRRVIITFCRWLDLKCGLLVSEATALPTEPNLLHSQIFAYLGNNITLNQLPSVNMHTCEWANTEYIFTILNDGLSIDICWSRH